MPRLRNLPLFLQVSLVIALITIFISSIMLVSLPHSLRDFFTKEIYNTIEAAQASFIYPRDHEDFAPSGLDPENIRTVKHMILLDDGTINSQVKLAGDFVEEATKNALRQEASKGNYVFNTRDYKLFYSIRRLKLENIFGSTGVREGYLISFLNDSYREDLVRTLFRKLGSLTLIILAISLIPSLLLSKYISRPLVTLEARVEELAQRKWQEELSLDRKDEIGRLGDSIEKLRLELIRQDRAEQNFLQNISHELKTPIMVIKSYTEAIKDGVYPGGSLESSLDIIGEETDRLAKKVRSLLYITKLDYMANFSLDKSSFDLAQLVLSTVDKYSFKQGLDLVVDLDSWELEADREQIQIVLENILDNMLRYARTRIELGLEAGILRIYNDGPPIEDLDSIFRKFHKGSSGEVGLGLSIVKKILDLHHYKISARNEEAGVSFYIDFNKE